jgi:hypothetical protein
LLSDNTVGTHIYSLLILLAVSLFLFLSHKVVILLEIQVYLLADPMLPIRKVQKSLQILAYSVCRGADVRPK